MIQVLITKIILILLTTTLYGQVILRDSSTRTVLENGYIQVQFNKQYPQIDVVKADFLGGSKYGNNLIADKGEYSGVVLERQSYDGVQLQRHSSSFGATEG